jgi:hypothetical protein
MRSVRRSLVGVAILLMAVQAAAVLGPAVAACGRRGATGVVCLCCRSGSCDCPMCSRARHVGLRCTAGCQGRSAPLTLPLDVLAVVPDRTTEHVCMTAEAAPDIPTRSAVDISPVPATPPPRGDSTL